VTAVILRDKAVATEEIVAASSREAAAVAAEEIEAQHVAEADSDDGALFFAHGVIQLEEKSPEVLCTKAAAFLDFAEPRACVFHGDASDEVKLDGWYLDSGATHHMSGRREIFELDTTVRGTVKFSDASRMEIQGVGSVVFQAKNGEYRVLHGVYFIPALRNSIMSLGQLDEAGSKVEIEHGVLRIWDECKRLLAKVKSAAATAFTFFISTPCNLFVLLRGRTTMPAAGTRGLDICTSTLSIGSGRRRWPEAFR